MIQFIKRIMPIYRKETMVSNRTSQLTVTVLVFNFLLAVIGLFQLWLMVRESGVYGSMNYSTMLMIYLMIATLEIVLLLLIVPALTAGAISGERERQTLDMLLCTRLHPVDIIVGKLLSTLSTVLVLMISSLPCLSLVYIYGGVGLMDLAVLLVGMGFIAFYSGSISISYSCVMQKTTASTVVSYLTFLFLVFGTEVIQWIAYRFGVAFLSWPSIADGSWMRKWNWILLWNPAATFASLFDKQIGSLSNYFSLVYQQEWLLPDCLYTSWWLPLSFLVQALTALIFLFFGCRALSPRLRKK